MQVLSGTGLSIQNAVEIDDGKYRLTRENNQPTSAYYYRLYEREYDHFKNVHYRQIWTGRPPGAEMSGFLAERLFNELERKGMVEE